MNSQIARIRAELSLPRAWKILGLPGEAKINCDLKSPFRQDKKPSFRIYEGKDHLRWFDHGDASGGDVLDLWATAKGIEPREAIREIQAYLGGGEVPQCRFAELIRPVEPVLPPEAKAVRFRPPQTPWRAPTQSDCRELAQLRGLPPGAFDLAGRLGTLKIGLMAEFPSWFITDASGICAEARRIDGLPYPKGNKAWALAGSKKDWPLGLCTDSPDFDAINNLLLVEGMPDYFAALQLAIESEIDFRPIAILGAGLTTFSAAQPYLTGKKIVIICHNDPQGQAALPKWVKECYRLGAKSVVSSSLPFLHDDLNDFLQNPGPNQPLELLDGFSHDNSSIRSAPKV